MEVDLVDLVVDVLDVRAKHVHHDVQILHLLLLPFRRRGARCSSAIAAGFE